MNTYQHPYVQLAKDSVRYFLSHKQKLPCPQKLSKDLREQAASFVSIRKNKQLRGCIGSLEPQEPNLAMEIIENAVKAAHSDPRFDPITPDEMDQLTFSIDVLTPLEKVPNSACLDPRVYGLVVKSNENQGVLLPDIEGVATVKEQLGICRAKGKIKEADPQELYRFKVYRFQ